MAFLDSADLLARVKADLNRPTTDEALGDPQLYSYLTEAQQRVMMRIAQNCPEAMLSAPTKLTTADAGLTYSFGTDVDTNAIFAFGGVEIRSSPKGRVILPGSDWDDTTERFIFDGSVIRWPGQRTRTFTDGPYARFMTPPNVVASGSQPVLVPRFARILMVYDACARASRRLKQDYTIYEDLFDDRWMHEVLPSMLKQYHGQGLMANSDITTLWFRNGF